jgi:predicted metal-dependent hydrolase
MAYARVPTALTKGLSRLHPEYAVRESARAKHVRFRVTMSDGLVVVIPKGFDRGQIPKLVEERRDWIARALKEIDARRGALPPTDHRPETIELCAIGRTWRLEWDETADEKVSITEIEPSRLRLAGSIEDRSAWRSTLRGWLVERGREHLIPWAESMASALGVQVQRVSIRCQKTRWGSYSTNGTINLNAQLLFLPERLVRFVLLHELCHAVHPNHSSSFWDLVRSHEPDADCLRKQLLGGWRYVPAWLARGTRRAA